MLDSKDLQAIAELLEQSVSASETRMIKHTNEAIAASEARMMKHTDEAIVTAIAASEARMMKHVEDSLIKSESMLLDEMERYDKKYEQRFDKIEQDLTDLKNIYHMTKYDHDTLNVLVHTMEGFEKRLTALESRTA